MPQQLYEMKKTKTGCVSFKPVTCKNVQKKPKQKGGDGTKPVGPVVPAGPVPFKIKFNTRPNMPEGGGQKK